VTCFRLRNTDESAGALDEFVPVLLQSWNEITISIRVVQEIENLPENGPQYRPARRVAELGSLHQRPNSVTPVVPRVHLQRYLGTMIVQY
jgi:hypothetical protein